MRSLLFLIIGLSLTLGGPTAMAAPGRPDLLQQVAPLAKPGNDAVIEAAALINAAAEGANNVLTGAGQDEASLDRWAAGIESQAGRLLTLADGIKPIREAEIRRLDAEAPGIGELLRVRSRINLDAAATARNAVDLSREVVGLVRKAQAGDEDAMQALPLRLVRGSRLLTQTLIVSAEGFLESMPESEAQWSLTAAQVESMRGVQAVFVYLETVAETGSGDARTAADRVATFAAQTRRRAREVSPKVRTTIQAMASQSVPDGMGPRIRQALESMEPSAQVELQIADVLDSIAVRMRKAPLDPGEDAWGLTAYEALQARRLEQHQARLGLLQGP